MNRQDRLRMLTVAHVEEPELVVGRNKKARVRVVVQDDYERIVICAVRGDNLLGACAITYDDFDAIDTQIGMSYAYVLALNDIEREIQLAFDAGEYEFNWNVED